MCAARAQHDTTRHDTFFISHVCKPVYACKIDDVKSTVQSSHVGTISVHDARVHVRNAHAKFGLRVYMQIVSQGQRNKLYKHVMY